MKKHQLMLASLAVLGASFLATSSNVQGAEQSKTGFIRENEKVYYYENGKKLSGWQLINVNTDDKKTTVQKLWIYLNQSGEVQTGWVQDKGTWYYLNELTGEYKGIAFMKKGFFEDVNKNWYYLDESGAMKENQWFQTNEGWYYADKSGAVKVNEWFQVGNKWYAPSEKGTIITNGFVPYKDEYYHFNASGEMSANEWFEANGSWYYANKFGEILRNTTTPDGYYVNARGEWV